MVLCARGNFFAGEQFVDLADAQARTETRCRHKAGQRIHSAICARPADLFAEHEAPCCCPRPSSPTQVPIYAEVVVHRRYHIQIGNALLCPPNTLVDKRLPPAPPPSWSNCSIAGSWSKNTPRQAPGGRSTDPEDVPTEKTRYAMRDLDRLIRAAASHGPNVGIYAERLLDHQMSWTKVRQAQLAAFAGQTLLIAPVLMRSCTADATNICDLVDRARST